ncbi:hypothetical protein [Paracoccus sp. PAR01]|uniref:hypothetical protein n=1 Tax=Paracoccus sp. PAR01 TaxID=2769282 RepID=UPI0017830237|nr:hypothetical protein [Paracoccus sp. PAR01]MBD9526469.1 hypothetical protein [Paracoccus sp. PAR01]
MGFLLPGGHGIGDFLPRSELPTLEPGQSLTGGDNCAARFGKERPMKAASVIINLGFGFGLALGAAMLLWL